MPVQGQGLGSQFQFASWRVPQFSRAIEYPLEVMEEIRAFACDELLQLSHGGDEVGGVLFGTRRDDLIRILTWRPMACEHTQGEALRLSYNDRMNLAVQLEVARQNSDLKDLRPVGWFVSHLHGDVSLSPSDLEIYSGFFPEAWQVTLVICPREGGRAQAGFFVREAEDKVLTESSYQCFDLEPLHLAPAAEVAPAEPIQMEPPPAVPAPPVQSAPAAPATQPLLAAPPAYSLAPQPPPRPNPVGQVEPRKAAPPRHEISPAPFQPPSFEVEERLPTHERWLWAIPIVLALGIAAFMLYQRRPQSQNTAIALRALNEAQTVQLVWDSNSRAVRDSDRAEIQINDGGKSRQVSLTSDQLHAGKMSYLPQSSDIGFLMTIYPASGEPMHDSTRLIAPVFSAPAAPTQPPLLLPTNPPVPPGADRQVRQLKEDLSKERARADELQNLVRILENRLGIPHEAPKSGRTH